MASGGEEGTARVLNGKEIAKDIRKQVTAEVETLKQQNPEFRPGLAIVQVN